MFKESDINDKITMDFIRLKLGRYTIDRGLQFCFDAQDVEEYNNKNRKIIELFDDYFNGHKIIIYSHKGCIKCAILVKQYYYYYNSILLNICGKDMTYIDNCLEEVYNNKIKEIINCGGDSTTEIIFNLIKVCNKYKYLE